MAGGMVIFSSLGLPSAWDRDSAIQERNALIERPMVLTPHLCLQFRQDRAETISHWEDVLRARRLSMRSGLRLLRVARTVADLRASDQVTMENLASALCFRSFDVAEPWS